MRITWWAAWAVVLGIGCADAEPAPETTSRAAVTHDGNLLTNPSFETDASGWAGWNARVERTWVRHAPDGGFAAKVTRTAGTSYSLDDQPETVSSVPEGASYTASAMVRAASRSARNKRVRLVLRARDASGAVSEIWESSPARLSRSFQALTVDATPAAGTTLDLYVFQDDAGRGDAFFADALVLQQVAGPGAPTEAPDAGTTTGGTEDAGSSGAFSGGLVANGSFEDGLDGWSGWNASLARASVSDAPHGTAAATVSHVAGSYYTIDDQPDTVPSAASGTAYEGSAFLRAASPSAHGKPAALILRERDGSGAVVRTWPSAYLTLDGTFRRVSVTAEPAAGNQLDLYIVQEGAAAGDSFAVDAVALTADASGSTEPPTGSEPPPSSTDPNPDPVGQGGEGWSLAFRDEFEGTSLDTSKWVPCFPWGSSRGCSSRTTPEMYYLPDNVIVGDGLVRLRARRESITVDGTSYRYTSGMISTAGYDGVSSYGYLFQYGYMEMRARVPAGQGLWPAFWTLPPEGAWPPEIDVVEILGHEPDVQHMHFHYNDRYGNHQDSGGSWRGPDFSADFHVFAVSWEPGAIRWYIDGVERRTAFTDTRYIPAEPMYLIANLQVGGSWPGAPDGTTPFPADYEIDYIRVWQR